MAVPSTVASRLSADSSRGVATVATSDLDREASVDIDADAADRDRAAVEAERSERVSDANAGPLAAAAAEPALVLVEPGEHVNVRRERRRHGRPG